MFHKLVSISRRILVCSTRPWARLEHGFLRVRCDTCHAEHLVAFSSCKRRGFCPSCGARGMVESAAELTELTHAIPQRVGRFLQRQELLERKGEQSFLAGTTVDEGLNLPYY